MQTRSLASSLCLLLTAFSTLTQSRSTQEWKPRSIYQIMTDRFARTDGSTTAPCSTGASVYCGGTWQGIIDNLDYVQGMGFDAIYISPVTENMPQTTTEGDGYHGYWPQNIYEVNNHFGTAQDLIALSNALHSRGMWLMVDVVINDMGYAIPSGGTESDIDYSVFTPFNDQKYFHSYCEITNYTNYTDAQWCWLGDDVVALPDLDTQEPEVLNIMTSWVKDLVSNYSVDGLRIDAAKHVDNDFLKAFSAAPEMFTIGEVYEGNAKVFCPYQELCTSMTDYPNYFAMIQAFTNGNISDLASQIAITKSLCQDTTILASFSENHDLPRFASFTQDMALAKTAIAWTIMSDGVPMVYQGQEQHFNGNATPYNREALWTTDYNTDAPLYQFIALMNKIRSHAITVDPTYVDYQSDAIYTDSSTIVLRKGNEGQQIVTVLSSSGDDEGAYTLMIPTAYGSGTEVMDVVTCTNTTVNEIGQLFVPMSQGLPHVYFPSMKMNGSQVCGMGNWTVPEGNGDTGPQVNSAITQDRSVYSSSIAIILAAVVAFCLL